MPRRDDHQLIVDHDGLHGMVERSGQIALHAGKHQIRIEFFENFEALVAPPEAADDAAAAPVEPSPTGGGNRTWLWLGAGIAAVGLYFLAAATSLMS